MKSIFYVYTYTYIHMYIVPKRAQQTKPPYTGNTLAPLATNCPPVPINKSLSFTYFLLTAMFSNRNGPWPNRSYTCQNFYRYINTSSSVFMHLYILDPTRLVINQFMTLLALGRLRGCHVPGPSCQEIRRRPSTIRRWDKPPSLDSPAGRHYRRLAHA
jgi:hypothetical protein